MIERFFRGGSKAKKKKKALFKYTRTCRSRPIREKLHSRGTYMCSAGARKDIALGH